MLKSVKILSTLVLIGWVTAVPVQAETSVSATASVDYTSEASSPSSTVASSVQVESSSTTSSVPHSTPSSTVPMTSVTTSRDKPTASSSQVPALTLQLKKPEIKDGQLLLKGDLSQAAPQALNLKLQVFQADQALADAQVIVAVKLGQKNVSFPALKWQGLAKGTYQLRVSDEQGRLLGKTEVKVTEPVPSSSSTTASSSMPAEQLDTKLTIQLTKPEVKAEQLRLKGHLATPLLSATDLTLIITDAQGQTTGISQTLSLTEGKQDFVFEGLSLKSLAPGTYHLRVTDGAGQLLAEEKLTQVSTPVSTSSSSSVASSTSLPSSSVVERPALPASSKPVASSSPTASSRPVRQSPSPQSSKVAWSVFDEEVADALDSPNQTSPNLSEEALVSEAEAVDVASAETPASNSTLGYATVRPNGRVVYTKGGQGYTASNAGKKVIVRPTTGSTGKVQAQQLPKTGTTASSVLTLFGWSLLLSVSWFKQWGLKK